MTKMRRHPMVDVALKALGRNRLQTGLTLLGILIPLFWQAAAVYAIIWLGLLLAMRISSLAGMSAAASAPVTAAILDEMALVPMLVGFALLIIWKHRENIRRLLKGEEPRVGKKKVEGSA